MANTRLLGRVLLIVGITVPVVLRLMGEAAGGDPPIILGHVVAIVGLVMLAWPTGRKRAYSPLHHRVGIALIVLGVLVWPVYSFVPAEEGDRWFGTALTLHLLGVLPGSALRLMPAKRARLPGSVPAPAPVSGPAPPEPTEHGPS